MIRRPRRTVPAVLVALVVLAGCTLTAICAIQLLLHRQQLISYHHIATRLHNTSWTDQAVLVGGAAVAALGLILLLAALWPGRALILPIHTPDTANPIDAGASRPGVRRSLRASTTGVDGVTKTKLRLGRRTLAMKLTTNRTNTAGLRDAAHATVNQRLDELSLADRPGVRIKVHAHRSAT